ncbi:MAG: AAA family ATPase [Chloroflexota bacterium]
MLKPLPVSTFTLRDIIENGCLYIDKTQYIYELIRYPKRTYFLSRPRRFGKSLLISTLHEIFRGNKDLFQNLWIHNSDYEWKVHPVIRIDFGQNTVNSAEKLEQVIDYYLEGIAEEYGLTIRGFDFQTRFQDLIRQLARNNQVVILIDEYDKPMIDNIENIPEAKRIRDTLKAFYAVIKAMDAHLHMTFITGISKFSQVGVFSALNNLVDLTMNTQFSSMLGLTDAELRRDFAEYSTALASELGYTSEALHGEIRRWYDGFCFAPNGENVYNPYSVIHLFFQRRFFNHWFATGTPTFLIKLIHAQNYDIVQFDEVMLEEIDFSTYELENLSVIPLLYQTGYLTLKGFTQELGKEALYTLSYPNYEVEHAFRSYLISAFSYIERTMARSYLRKLAAAIKEKDLDQVFSIMSVFFTNIPYDLQLKYEQYYQSILYTVFMMLGLDIEAEVETNEGRIDAVVELSDHILLFEFKIDKNAQEAPQQIKENKYYEKYQLHNKEMTLIGANFNSQTRTVDDWISETN